MKLFRKSPKRLNMTNFHLAKLLDEISPDVSGHIGRWQFHLRGRDMLVVTDDNHDRMRIMAPVTSQTNLDAEETTFLLEANYDRALDAKYALSKGVLWSVFMHPLADLTDALFKDAVEQVATLADNFGGTYASSNLFFTGR